MGANQAGRDPIFEIDDRTRGQNRGDFGRPPVPSSGWATATRSAREHELNFGFSKVATGLLLAPL